MLKHIVANRAYRYKRQYNIQLDTNKSSLSYSRQFPTRSIIRILWWLNIANLRGLGANRHMGLPRADRAAALHGVVRKYVSHARRPPLRIRALPRVKAFLDTRVPESW